MSWNAESDVSMLMPSMALPGDISSAASSMPLTMTMTDDPNPNPTANAIPNPNAKGKGKAKAKTKEAKIKEEGASTTVKKKKNTKKKSIGASTNGGGDQNDTMSTNGSRAGSIAPGANQSTAEGNNTPTKRKASTRGKGKGRGSTRADSKGSRATSARASMSAVPGQQLTNDTRGEGEEGFVEPQEDEDEEGEEEPIDDEEEGEEDFVGQGLEEEEWRRQEAIQKARSTAMGPLMKAMDDVQQDRYAVYRQSFLHKNTIRRLISHLTGQNPTGQVVSITAAMGKVFIGEIVERARKLQYEKDVTGPLQPEFLLEAHRLYKEEREKPGRYPPGAPSASAGTGGNGKRRRLF